MILSKEIVPHDIIEAKMGIATILTKELLQFMIDVQWLWGLIEQQYSSTNFDFSTIS